MARRRRKKQKAPWEFSKKIVVVVFSINIVVIVFSIIMMWRTCDLSLSDGIPHSSSCRRDRNRDRLLLLQGQG